ncbi:MAG: hypothetical protein OEM22_01565, partial [Acidimicrobiia bacterium]|nr:hypothetical protein [Acidimicrobiia bacterium]
METVAASPKERTTAVDIPAMGNAFSGSTRYRLLALFTSMSVIAALLAAASALGIQIPTPTSTAFQQTSAANAALGIGDWYTNVAGGNTIHAIHVAVPCGWPAATPITVALFDPEVNDGYSGSTPYAIDEIRDLGATDTSDEAFAEDTRFQFTAPGGTVLVPWRTFAPLGGTDGLWAELLTFDPSALAPADRCGTFLLHTETVGPIATTGNNDDNSWALRVNHDPDCSVSPGSCSAVGPVTSALMDNSNEVDNPDALPGTSDELAIAYTKATQQHGDAAISCQDYFFRDGGDNPTMDLRNFDMDTAASATITYFPPSGGSIAGTLSGNAAWATDTVPSDPGWWRAEVCINNSNQYIFDGRQGERVYFTVPPPTPRLTITKDDGVATANPGDTLTYSIDFTNISDATVDGAPAFNVEIADTIPAGTTYVSCQLLGGLSGTCSESGGVVTFEVTDTIFPVNGPLPQSGSVEVVVTVDPLTGGSITNSATVTYEDAYNDPGIPATDTDIDDLPDLVLTKTSNAGGFVIPGQSFTYTVVVENDGSGPQTNLDFTDVFTTAPGMVWVSTVIAPVVPATGPYDLPQTSDSVTLAAGNAFTITMTFQVDDPLGAAVTDVTNTISVTSVETPVSRSDDATDPVIRPVTLSDYVWEDDNGDGIQDGTESGVAGVLVTAVWYGPDLTLGTGDDTTASDTTDGSGLYSIPGLMPGNHEVTFSSLPAGMVFSATDQGGDDALDSDPDGSGVVTVTVTSGVDDDSVDAGAYTPGSIGDLVWDDLD